VAQDHLAVFLSRAASRGFVWGTHDCMLFAADWALALTGSDPAAAWRGTYNNEATARELMIDCGGAHALMGQALAAIGWHPVCGDRQAGDIVLADPPRHAAPSAGVVSHNGRVALLTRRGLVFWPSPMLWAWRHG
jgi:hypothetical protein